MANVFISYLPGDKTPAQLLTWQIKGHGHEVWLDLWTAHLGDSIIDKINKGLTG